MNEPRIDRIATALAKRRLTRRSAIVQTGVGLGVAATAVPFLTGAQEESPSGTPAAGVADDVEFLFVQTFQSSTLSPKQGEEGRYLLTLQQGGGQTLYFSDRPERIVGMLPTSQFLDGLGFTPANPPNAALVAETEEGGEEIVVVELFDPQYDAEAQSLTYEVRILLDQERVDMAFMAVPAGEEHPGATYGASHLFIDDCPSHQTICDPAEGDAYSMGCVSSCWNTTYGACTVCTGIMEQCCGSASPTDGCGVTTMGATCS